jgi:hypothetical protein
MPLSEGRATPERKGDIHSIPMAAQLIYEGSIVCRNSSGYAAKGAASTTLVGIGRAEERVDNSGGNAGDKSILVKPGIFRFGNSASSDAIAITEIGKPCYVVDDQTVAKTDGSGARSIAGFVHDVDAQGVWVRFDEVLVRNYLAGVTLPEA